MSMTSPHSTTRRWPWILAAASVSALAVGILWPLQYVNEVCIAISVYPPPPGCGPAVPLWAPVAGIVVIVALFCALVIVAATVSKPRMAMIFILAAMVAVLAIAVAAVLIPQATLIYPSQPVPYVD